MICIPHRVIQRRKGFAKLVESHVREFMEFTVLVESFQTILSSVRCALNVHFYESNRGSGDLEKNRVFVSYIS